MIVTSSNLLSAKARCVKLAGEVAKARDGGCIMDPLDKTHWGDEDASHVVPRSRGFWYACNPRNIICLCRRHHGMWHENEERARALIEKIRPSLLPYTDALTYPAEPITPEKVQKRLDWLEESLKKIGAMNAEPARVVVYLINEGESGKWGWSCSHGEFNGGGERSADTIFDAQTQAKLFLFEMAEQGKFPEALNAKIAFQERMR